MGFPEKAKGKKIWSFSRLTAFDECQWSWDQQYNKGIKGINNAWGELGHICHDIIERNAKGILPVEGMADEFYVRFAQMEFRFPFPAMKASYKKKLGEFFENFRPFQSEIYGIEDQFCIEIDRDSVLLGFLDFVYGDGESINVLDWKISKPFKGEDELKKKRQLLIYARACKDLYGVFPKKMIFYFMKDNVHYSYDFDKEEMKEALLWVKSQIKKIESEKDWKDAIVTRIESGQSPASILKSDSFFCQNLCNHREICPSLKKLRNGGFQK